MAADNIVVDFSEGHNFLSWHILVRAGLVTFGLAIILVAIAKMIPKGQNSTTALVGLAGRSMENIAPDGQVYVNGEIWKAISIEGIIERDQEVVVVGVKDGLILEVRRKRTND